MFRARAVRVARQKGNAGLTVRLPRRPAPRVPLHAESARAVHAGLSGPLLDRIDLHVEVAPVKYRELGATPGGESSAPVAARIAAARERQVRTPRLRAVQRRDACARAPDLRPPRPCRRRARRVCDDEARSLGPRLHAGAQGGAHHCRPRRRGSGRRASHPSASTAHARRSWTWADLMRRVFSIDVLACAGCGGRLRFIATAS